MVNKNQNLAKGKENAVLPKNGYKGEQIQAFRPEPVQSIRKDLSVLSIVPVSEERVLPPGVKDIDEDDGDNPQLCSDYATETYVYLKQLEKHYTVRANHLLAGFPTNAKMRAQLIDWLVEVQVQFKLTQETFFLTVHTIDRFMALEGNKVPRSKLQLVGVSAMFLMSKVEEIYPPTLSDFVFITNFGYNNNDIQEMERRIVRALNFDFCQPISLNFLRRYSKAGEVDVLTHYLAKYTLEICLLDYDLVNISSSLLAAASLWLSLYTLDTSLPIDTLWSPTLEYYSGYSSKEVQAVVPRTAHNLTNARTHEFQCIQTKYESGRFLRVSQLEQLKSLELACLAMAC